MKDGCVRKLISVSEGLDFIFDGKNNQMTVKI